jgi:hypothetical protein
VAIQICTIDPSGVSAAAQCPRPRLLDPAGLADLLVRSQAWVRTQRTMSDFPMAPD